MSTMGKEKRKPTNLELFFLDKQELDEMTSTDAFQSFVKQETYTAIVDAVKRKKKKAQIFRLWNLGFLVTIKEEAAKCEVLCANCHMKLHAKEQSWYS